MCPSPGEEEPGQFRAVRGDSHVGLDVGGGPATPPVISLPLTGGEVNTAPIATL